MKKIVKLLNRRISALRGHDFPVDRIIGKSFVRPGLLPHKRLLEQYESHGRDNVDWLASEYAQAILGGRQELSSSFGSLPQGLDVPPTWWVMPWASFPGKNRSVDPKTIEQKTLRKIHEFFDLYESISRSGYDPRKGGAISGYMLVHPDCGEIFNQIDGHHRLAILDYLTMQGRVGFEKVRIKSLGRVVRADLGSCPTYVEGVENNLFTESDAFALFDHPFRRLGLLPDTE